MYPVITFSREFGSGGHSIAKAVAEKLGVPFFDKEIVDEVAAKSGFAEDFVEKQGEHTSTFDRWFAGNMYGNNYYDSAQDAIFKMQRNFIEDKAKEGPCVIVGRCADYFMKETDIKTLRVFIHADLEHRKARIIERYGEPEDIDIDRSIHKKDKGRKAYYHYYTDQEWGDAANYDLCIDTSNISEENAVDLIVILAKAMDE